MDAIDRIAQLHEKRLAEYKARKADLLAASIEGNSVGARLANSQAGYLAGLLNGLEDAASVLNDRIGDKLMADSRKAADDAFDAYMRHFYKEVA